VRVDTYRSVEVLDKHRKRKDGTKWIPGEHWCVNWDERGRRTRFAARDERLALEGGSYGIEQ
jgi:hypothetical protein